MTYSFSQLVPKNVNLFHCNSVFLFKCGIVTYGTIHLGSLFIFIEQKILCWHHVRSQIAQCKKKHLRNKLCPTRRCFLFRFAIKKTWLHGPCPFKQLIDLGCFSVNRCHEEAIILGWSPICYPYRPCMVYLPTVDYFLWYINVGKYTIHGEYGLYTCHYYWEGFVYDCIRI